MSTSKNSKWPGYFNAITYDPEQFLWKTEYFQKSPTYSAFQLKLSTLNISKHSFLADSYVTAIVENDNNLSDDLLVFEQDGASSHFRQFLSKFFPLVEYVKQPIE